MNVVIAGGTGFLGERLVRHYQPIADNIFILTRGRSRSQGNVRYIHWDGRNPGDWKQVIEGASLLINLCGKSVDCRYTSRNKALICSSRVDATLALGYAIQQCAVPPGLWINSSSATIYRHADDRDMDEETGEIGSGFSVEVCQAWEHAFMQAHTPATRKVILRTAIVLGRNGGALLPLKRMVHLGLGGRHGDGNQYMSWLHEDDFVAIIRFIATHAHIDGVVNASAPFPLPDKVFMKTLRCMMRRAISFPLPQWLLEAGALLIGTETELLLKSRRVVPKRLLDNGFRFRFPTLGPALHDLCGGRISERQDHPHPGPAARTAFY